MSKKKDDFKNRVVFSTNPDYKPDEEETTQENVPANAQTLYVSLERLKGGKVATIVEKFAGTEAELQDLGKQLKNRCGVGGTVKDGIILVQGEQRDKVMKILAELGFKTKRKGG